jgi:adenylate cyclase
VVGDTANLASRLEGANKAYGSTIMITEETRRLAGDAIEARELDRVCVMGRTEAVRVYELLARKGELPFELEEIRRHFEASLALYRAQRWDEAQAGFERCGDDPPSKVFLERIRQLRAEPPAADWDGSWTLDKK